MFLRQAPGKRKKRVTCSAEMPALPGKRPFRPGSCWIHILYPPREALSLLFHDPDAES